MSSHPYLDGYSVCVCVCVQHNDMSEDTRTCTLNDIITHAPQCQVGRVPGSVHDMCVCLCMHVCVCKHVCLCVCVCVCVCEREREREREKRETWRYNTSSL